MSRPVNNLPGPAPAPAPAPVSALAPAPSAEEIVRLWPLSPRRPASERTVGLLLALDGPTALDYPLGTRNRRLLAVHGAVVRRPVQAHVGCPACGTDSEFTLPVRTVAGLPAAEADAVARLLVDGAVLTFRLPVLADLTPFGGRPPAGSLRALAAGTCLEPPVPHLGPDDLDRLADAWEALDPAGSLRVHLSCPGCEQDIAADADPAAFVARDLDLLVAGLLREIDVIAGGYGWSEEAILRLPAERRQRYVELVTEGRSPARRLAEAR